MKLFKNKRGYSTGFAWVFGLVSMFGLGILYITFDQVFVAHLVPVIKNTVNTTGNVDEATKNQIYAEIDKYMAFFHAMPYILFIVIVIFLFFTAIRKERESEFG